MIHEFKYDVAFSFLAEDEELVSTVDGQLNDRYSTFVFSKKQNELAGTDGMEKLSDVFKNQSRLNVVFFRSKWGKTPWTAIEQDAIKDAIFSEISNWDRFLLIHLEPPAKRPTWIPDTNIYLDFKQYGLEKVIGNIEYKIQTLGGKKIPDDSVSMALRKDKKIETQKTIKQYLLSEKAIIDSTSEVQEFFNLIKNKREKLKSNSNNIGLGSVVDYNENKLFMVIEGFQFDVQWIRHYHNSLSQSYLSIRILDPNDMSFVPIKIVNSDKYEFQMNELYQLGWYSNNESKFISTYELSELWFKEFINVALADK